MKNKIKELRQKNNLTLKELGCKFGMAISTVSEYERGRREPKPGTWKKLANYFNVSVPYLQGIDATYREKPCEYCNFSMRDCTQYPLYDGDKCLGFVYLNHDHGITVDLRKIGSIRTREAVKRCPNCGRDLKK